MKRIVSAVAAVILLGTSLPALAAQDEPSTRERMDEAGQALKDSLASLMAVIQKMVSNIPQYEAPQILDNGDIIIRRKHPDGKTDDSAKDGPIKTSVTKPY